MEFNQNKNKIGYTLLRLSLSFVFLWFGFSQLENAALWTGFVPAWATNFMDAGSLVLLNGLFEIIAGSLLAFNVLTKWIALILGIHLFVIASALGFTAVGVRDMGLSIATISLFFLGD